MTGAVNLDAALAEVKSGKKVKSRITMVGVELEGGWLLPVPGGTRVIRDGSVRGIAHPQGGVIVEVGSSAWSRAQVNTDPVTFARANRRSGESVEAARIRLAPQIAELQSHQSSGVRPMEMGEIPSPPMPTEQVEVWMRRYYPQAVNETCGMHVHMSFENALHYQRLMVPAYQDTVLKYITEWAKEEKLPSSHGLWPRLRGESRYCQHRFWADHQVRTTAKDHDQSREGHRYTVINYCYRMTGTVECRLLPMMENTDRGIRAVTRLLDITNAFLARGKHREAKLLASVVVASDDPISHTRRVTLSEERRSGEIS